MFSPSKEGEFFIFSSPEEEEKKQKEKAKKTARPSKKSIVMIIEKKLMKDKESKGLRKNKIWDTDYPWKGRKNTKFVNIYEGKEKVVDVEPDTTNPEQFSDNTSSIGDFS